MFLFGGPNIRKMAEERDVDGLVALLSQRSAQVRLEAAEALARLNDGRGWRYLLDAVRDPADSLIQAATAEILGGLGHARAIPALQEAALRASGEAAAAIEEALEQLGDPRRAEADGDEHHAGQRPERQMDGRGMLGSLVGSFAGGEGGMDNQFVDPARPASFTDGHIEVQPAETHLANAIELRESEMQERGLVAAGLAAWLRPDWAQVWYVRGVLLEDLEREREALLAYHQALALDPSLSEAREAHAELQESIDPLPVEPAALLSDLAADDWRRRRDALAVLTPRISPDSELVLALLADEEREVRHAAIEAIARLRLQAAVGTLLAQHESSWLLRFAILDALSVLGAVDALVERLRQEMARLQERNPVFTSAKDPLVELEYGLVLEIGLLALERTGDVAGLLDQAEGNTWESQDAEDEDSPEDEGLASDDEYDEEDPDSEEEADEDLLSYVDETGLMVAQALEHLAAQRLPDLPQPLVQRLSETPDLTLLDLSVEDSQPAVAHDFSALRAAAAAELRRRGE